MSHPSRSTWNWEARSTRCRIHTTCEIPDASAAHLTGIKRDLTPDHSDANLTLLPSILATNPRKRTLAKHYELRGRIEQAKYEIILMTETWFTTHTKGNYKCPYRTQITANRSETCSGGGLAMFINYGYHAKKACSHLHQLRSPPCSLYAVSYTIHQD